MVEIDGVAANDLVSEVETVSDELVVGLVLIERLPERDGVGDAVVLCVGDALTVWLVVAVTVGFSVLVADAVSELEKE